MKCPRIASSILSATVLGFLALGLASTSASAATLNTTTFQVTAGVGNSCSVNATSLAFGTIQPNATGGNNATSTVTINCTLNDVYSVGLSAGANGGSETETSRFMVGAVNGTYHLNYSLHSGSASGTNWGTAAGQVTGTGSGSAQTLTVYGVVPQQTSPGNDNYSDTITVNLTY